MFSESSRELICLLNMFSESSRELIRLLNMLMFLVRLDVVLLNWFSVSFDVDRRKEEEHNHCRRGLSIILLIVLPE